MSEERGYELLSQLDDYQGDNAQLLDTKENTTRLYTKKYMVGLEEILNIMEKLLNREMTIIIKHFLK